jgi:hypothetical protein
MEFTNESAFPAELVRSALSPDESEPMLAFVVLKVAYTVTGAGEVRLAEEQEPFRYEAEETDLGVLPPDTAPVKPGIDVLLLGRALAPQGKPVPRMTVKLEVGESVRELAVFGDRRWVKQPPQGKPKKRKKNEPEPEPLFAASAPEPFTAIPLTYANAYGGKAKLGVYDAPNPYNLEGKGYCLEVDEAEDLALPNVEDPRALIREWRDQPRPAGFAPLPLGTLFTVERGVVHDAQKKEQTVRPEVFQNAHPDLVFTELPPGTPVAVTGMNEGGRFAFAVPDLRARVAVSLGEKEYRPEGHVDTLTVYPEAGRIVLTHRTPFKYRIVPEEVRTARLVVESAGASA